MEDDHHVLRKEEGLRTYLEEHDFVKKISRLFIEEADFSLIAKKLDSAFEELKPQVVFVSNSRVSSVARFLQDRQIQDVRLIGFDYMPDNLKYLQEEVIDFLICHKPIEQGFMAVKSLFNKIVLNRSAQKINFMPLIMEWEGTYPFKNHPLIPNQYAYTREEVVDVVNYCEELGIDVIPLQQSVGHVEYNLRHYRYKELREDQKIFLR